MCSSTARSAYDPWSTNTAKDPGYWAQKQNQDAALIPGATAPPGEPTLTDLVNKWSKTYETGELATAGGQKSDFMSGAQATIPNPAMDSVAAPSPPGTTPKSNPNIAQPPGIPKGPRY